MMPRVRRTLFLICMAGFSGILLWGFHGLPSFGHYLGPYGNVLAATAPFQRHVANVVTAVNYDYRGMDTLGEEFILFVAVTGVALLLRQERGEVEGEAPDAISDRRVPDPSEAIRALGGPLLGVTVLLGIYIILHGHLTPGGGFQGGTVVASGWMVAYIAGRHRTYQRLGPQSVVEATEALGSGAYAMIGLATLASGAAFLQNVLPQGSLGDFLSSGTIWLINFAVGIAVAAGLVLVVAEFLDQALSIHGGGDAEHNPDGDTE